MTTLEVAAAAPVSRRDWIVGGVFFTTPAAAFAATPRSLHEDFTALSFPQLMPARLGPWTAAPSAVDVVPDLDSASSKVEQTYSVTYVGDGVPSVLLLMAYHGPLNGDIKAHRPETCYTVAGFSLSRDRPVSVPVAGAPPVPARAFTGARGERVEHVLYWTRIGDRFPTSMTNERLDVLLASLGGVVADGLLMRLSILGGDGAAATRWLQTFAAHLCGQMPPVGRRLLLGAA
jgi:EpsI family protein